MHTHTDKKNGGWGGARVVGMRAGMVIDKAVAPFQVGVGEEGVCPTGSDGAKDFRMTIGTVNNPGLLL
jgi:hypothetical protein